MASTLTSVNLLFLCACFVPPLERYSIKSSANSTYVVLCICLGMTPWSLLGHSTKNVVSSASYWQQAIVQRKCRLTHREFSAAGVRGHSNSESAWGQARIWRGKRITSPCAYWKCEPAMFICMCNYLSQSSLKKKKKDVDAATCLRTSPACRRSVSGVGCGPQRYLWVHRYDAIYGPGYAIMSDKILLRECGWRKGPSLLGKLFDLHIDCMLKLGPGHRDVLGGLNGDTVVAIECITVWVIAGCHYFSVVISRNRFVYKRIRKITIARDSDL